jgi:2-keto-4-pentenoate hydratase/2-oxohepta-3-ene-1,7-dioic acid hydratase in catechol pathway
LTTDMTLDNGTIVMTNGTVKAKDGSTTTLKEGDYVTMDGTSMGNMNDWKKDPQLKDSTMTDKMKTDSLK